jgi:ABC-type glycerol-3-phosphate transport system permease component
MKNNSTRKIFVVLLTLLFCAFAVFPLLWMISSSVQQKSGMEEKKSLQVIARTHGASLGKCFESSCN